LAAKRKRLTQRRQGKGRDKPSAPEHRRSARRKKAEALFLLGLGGPLLLLGLFFSSPLLFLFGGVLAAHSVLSLVALRKETRRKE
jgi:hypothetical protein